MAIAADPSQLNLGDFYQGHDTDPLLAPPAFTEWRAETSDYQALIERRLATKVDAHAAIAWQGRPLPVLNFASLDYLGMASNPQVIAAQQAALATWGNGSAGVPLLSGMTTLHAALEDQLNAMTGKGGTLLFTSGFAAAIGMCVALLHRGDIAVLDERAHMSWMDGVRLSGARLVTFAHNDPEALDAALERTKGSRRCVIVDGLYSMDGDFAPLSRLLDVADQHGVGIVVDEAHSVFADGGSGGGLTERTGEQKRIRVFMGTFSKALSVVGGFVSGDRALIDYLRYFSHPYVFSGAMPPGTVAGISAAVELVRTDQERRNRLFDNSKYMRDRLQALGVNTGRSESWIVPIIFGSRRDLLFQSVQELMARGVFVAPVDYPAVAEDQVRIRLAISANHTRADLDAALNHLEDVALPLLRVAGQLRL